MMIIRDSKYFTDLAKSIGFDIVDVKVTHEESPYDEPYLNVKFRFRHIPDRYTEEFVIVDMEELTDDKIERLFKSYIISRSLLPYTFGVSNDEPAMCKVCKLRDKCSKPSNMRSVEAWDMEAYESPRCDEFDGGDKLDPPIIISLFKDPEYVDEFVYKKFNDGRYTLVVDYDGNHKNVSIYLSDNNASYRDTLFPGLPGVSEKRFIYIEKFPIEYNRLINAVDRINMDYGTSFKIFK